jgi:hypothetical protein
MGLENVAIYRAAEYRFQAGCKVKYDRVWIKMKYCVTMIPKLPQRKRYNMGCPFPSTVRRSN